MKKEKIESYEWQVGCPYLENGERPVVIQSDDPEGKKIIGVYCVYGQVGESNGIPFCRKYGLCRYQIVEGGFVYEC